MMIVMIIMMLMMIVNNGDDDNDGWDDGKRVITSLLPHSLVVGRYISSTNPLITIRQRSLGRKRGPAGIGNGRKPLTGSAVRHFIDCG